MSNDVLEMESTEVFCDEVIRLEPCFNTLT